ncbi:hypothetical protein [Negadavirga shengliensis]|uniref:Uncharacterized protein n=1 Tax=Negadavirga shengliensis TaxID=1389218 RepID=A0ABV9T5D1_9BACT
MKTSVLEKTVESTIEKLNKLKLDDTLTAELQWCLGSYRHDKNPEGLLEKSLIALTLLKEKREENSKAVSKKLIADLEKLVVD